MLPFRVNIRPGIPLYEQVVYAVKRAIASGQLKPGDRMPSVRDLSRGLQINPNTAQKVLAALANEKLIEVSPGIGSVVADRAKTMPDKLALILGEQLETVIIEAVTFSIDEATFVAAVHKHWKKIVKEK